MNMYFHPSLFVQDLNLIIMVPNTNITGKRALVFVCDYLPFTVLPSCALSYIVLPLLFSRIALTHISPDIHENRLVLV
jgi:hypothetical protein